MTRIKTKLCTYSDHITQPYSILTMQQPIAYDQTQTKILIRALFSPLINFVASFELGTDFLVAKLAKLWFYLFVYIILLDKALFFLSARQTLKLSPYYVNTSVFCSLKTRKKVENKINKEFFQRVKLTKTRFLKHKIYTREQIINKFEYHQSCKVFQLTEGRGTKS